MQIITGFFIILVHLVAGNLLSGLIGGFAPGSVIGMILLFISLMTGLVKDHQIRRVATFLTDNNYHMFKVTASSATSTLDIKVTDRFGNVYTESMKRPKAFEPETYK